MANWSEGFFQFAQLNKVLPALPATGWKWGNGMESNSMQFAMSKLIMQ